MEKGEVQKKEPRREPRKGRRALVLIGLVLVAATFYVYPKIASGKMPERAYGTLVAAPRSYVGKIEQATTIVPELEAGRASLKLEEVDRLNIVDFQWENGAGDPVVVMAYITSSGHLFVGHSRCGCGGDRFFLAGEVLVCHACRTTFTIEDQKFLSGSATAGRNPPSRIRSAVEDGMIVVEQADLGD